MWSLTGASELRSCWMSVFTPTNSTWEMPASIIRLTAFRPPPPTPTTRMTARYADESGRGALWRRRGSASRVTGGSSQLCSLSARGACSGSDAGAACAALPRGAWAGGSTGSGAVASGPACSAVGKSSPAGSRAGSSRPDCRWAASVALKSSARGPSRMLTRRRAIEHLLGEVAVRLRGRAGRVVLEHRAALDGRLGIANRLLDLRVEDEVAEVFLQHLDRLLRVECPPIKHGREDAPDLHGWIQVLAN